MKLKHAQQELKTKQAQVKKMDGGYKKDQDTFEAVKKCIEKLQAEMKKLNYEGTEYFSNVIVVELGAVNWSRKMWIVKF